MAGRTACRVCRVEALHLSPSNASKAICDVRLSVQPPRLEQQEEGLVPGVNRFH